MEQYNYNILYIYLLILKIGKINFLPKYFPVS